MMSQFAEFGISDISSGDKTIYSPGGFQPNTYQSNAFQSGSEITIIRGGEIQNQLMYPGISSGSVEYDVPLVEKPLGYITYLYEKVLNGTINKPLKLTVDVEGKIYRNINNFYILKGQVNKKIHTINFIDGNINRILKNEFILEGQINKQIFKYYLIDGNINKYLEYSKKINGYINSDEELYYLIYELLLDK